MKTSFNEATTMKKAILEQDLVNWFENHHLKPYSFNALEFFTL